MIEPFNGGPADQPYNDHNAETRVIVHYDKRMRYMETAMAASEHGSHTAQWARGTILRAMKAEASDPTPYMEQFTPIDRFGLWGERPTD